MKFQKKFSQDYPCMCLLGVTYGMHLKDCTYLDYLAFAFSISARCKYKK